MLNIHFHQNKQQRWRNQLNSNARISYNWEEKCLTKPLVTCLECLLRERQGASGDPTSRIHDLHLQLRSRTKPYVPPKPSSIQPANKYHNPPLSIQLMTTGNSEASTDIPNTLDTPSFTNYKIQTLRYQFFFLLFFSWFLSLFHDLRSTIPTNIRIFRNPRHRWKFGFFDQTQRIPTRKIRKL